MLYICWMVILGDHNIIKRNFENSIAFGKSTSHRIYPEQHTPKIEHALHSLDGHIVWSQYQRKKMSETSIFELPRVKNCISRLCTNPL